MTYVYAAIGILGMTAIIGIYLLSLVLKDKETPKKIAAVHGIFAIIALILLIVYAYDNPPGPIESIIILSIAATSGILTVYTHITNKKAPKWLAVAHGLTALVGYVLLLLFALFKY